METYLSGGSLLETIRKQGMEATCMKRERYTKLVRLFEAYI